MLSGRALQEAEQWLQTQPAAAEAPTALHLEYIKAGRDAATRRRNVLTGGLAAGLVLAVGLAGVALWQRGIAVEQQASRSPSATRPRRASRSPSGRQSAWCSISREGLRNVQGMSAEAVRKILETAQAAFDQLAASAPDDLDLQRSRSVMLDEFGDTYLTLGDLEAALKAYREASPSASASPPPIAAIRGGSATCRCPTTGSATCWWRRASSMTRSRPTATASPSASASPPPIAAIRAGDRTKNRT